jgi:hypothetical protein
MRGFSPGQVFGGDGIVGLFDVCFDLGGFGHFDEKTEISDI